jgi:hypothetical protein
VTFAATSVIVGRLADGDPSSWSSADFSGKAMHPP